MNTQLWQQILAQANVASEREPSLASFYYAHVLNHCSLASALSFSLSERLGSQIVPATLIRDVIDRALQADASILIAAAADIEAVYDRDPACETYLMPLLFFKGYQALQAHRIAHWLWGQGRAPLALYFQSLINERFQVDIHPAAVLGKGIMLDHATGIVIGETTEVGDDVSILHSVTLGGSGCTQAKRHPTIGAGVLIAAGAKVLGPVCVGEGAKLAAGSLVLADVAPHSTVAGVPATEVASGMRNTPALDMEQNL